MKKWSQDVEFFIYKCGEKSSNTSLNDSEMFRINNFQRYSCTSYTLPNLDTKRNQKLTGLMPSLTNTPIL